MQLFQVPQAFGLSSWMCGVLTAAHGSLDHSFVLRLPISFTACFHLVEVSGAPAHTKKVRKITYRAIPTLKNLGIERALFENVQKHKFDKSEAERNWEVDVFVLVIQQSSLQHKKSGTSLAPKTPWFLFTKPHQPGSDIRQRLPVWKWHKLAKIMSPSQL